MDAFEMSDQDWVDWTLLLEKYDSYAVQTGIYYTDAEPLQVILDLLDDDEGSVITNDFKVIDLTGDRGLHLDIQIVYEIEPEKNNLRISANPDPETGLWVTSLQSGEDRIMFGQDPNNPFTSSYVFADNQGSTFDTQQCFDDSESCQGEQEFTNWQLNYEWILEESSFNFSLKDAQNRVVISDIDLMNPVAYFQVVLSDGSVILDKAFNIIYPSSLELV